VGACDFGFPLHQNKKLIITTNGLLELGSGTYSVALVHDGCSEFFRLAGMRSRENLGFLQWIRSYAERSNRGPIPRVDRETPGNAVSFNVSPHDLYPRRCQGVTMLAAASLCVSHHRLRK